MENSTKSTCCDKSSMESTLNSLKSSIAHLTENGELETTDVPELSLFHRNEPTQLVTTLYEPSICLVIQGEKRVILGEDTYFYGPDKYLIVSVNLPATVQVLKASPKQPYLGLLLKLDRREISQLMIDSSIPSTSSMGQSKRAMATGTNTVSLLAAFKRLVDLLSTPQDIPILSPLIQKEIIYRLLVGEQGTLLRQTVSVGTHSHNIAKVIDWVKINFTRPLTIDDLTKQACMSNSTFHHHFRSITAMSPLQYVKTLRLYEARRLMLTEDYDAASASYKVGYDSPSQFSREYKRQFGDSPQRDIKKLSGELISGKTN